MIGLRATTKASLPCCTLLFEKSVGSYETHQKILSWMLSLEVDPQRPAPAACGGSFQLPDDYGVEIQVEYGGHSAISMAVALLTIIRDVYRDDYSRIDLNDAELHLKKVLPLMARSLSKPWTSLINRWRLMQETSESHDATFETKDGAVTCHSSILRVASPALRAMLVPKFKEGADKRIEVESSKAVVRLFLDILYTGSVHQDSDYNRLGCFELGPWLGCAERRAGLVRNITRPDYCRVDLRDFQCCGP